MPRSPLRHTRPVLPPAASALALALGLSGLPPAPALADTTRPVTSRAEFLGLVEGRALTRLGISLSVAADGTITGRAFGTPVTGSWDWRDGYFCRAMQYGQTEIAANCQSVEQRGNALRFTSDRGAGAHADLRLR